MTDMDGVLARIRRGDADDVPLLSINDARRLVALASGSPEPVLEPHPGVNHDFTGLVCRLCGDTGRLFVAFITDGDEVRIEPRPVSDTEEAIR